MTNDITLTELMGARFCHDMAGPISAVNNGLEFLREENNDMKERALELVEASAREAVIRLQFFRLAYGIAPQEGEVDIVSLKDLIKQYFSLGKMSMDWPGNHAEISGIPLSHRMGRLILNMIIIAASTLIYGGIIAIRLTKTPDGYQVSVSGSGKNIKIFPEIVSILQEDGNVPMDKRNVQVHFTKHIAKQLGVHIQVHQTDNTIELVTENKKLPIPKDDMEHRGTVNAV